MKILKFLSILLLNYLLINAQNLPNLDCWAKKILALNQRPINFKTLPNRKKYQQNILKFNDFFKVIKQTANILKDQMQNNDQWVFGRSIKQVCPQLFNLDRTIFTRNITKNFIFEPYAQRIIVQPKSSIIFFGDLHGSVHSFIRSLLKLKNDGLIDNNFKIQNSRCYILFLGDYTDRGIYGVEVFYTILRLKIANPNNVFFVRGNHEDYAVSVEFSTSPEKKGIPSFVNELRYKFNTSKEQEIKIFRLYDLLPVVIYVGSGKLGGRPLDHITYIQCCHGGMEIGFNPKALLHFKICNLNNSKNSSAGRASKDLNCLPRNTFQLIEKLERRTNYYKKFNKSYQYLIKNSFSVDRLCTDLQDFTPKAPFEIVSRNVHKNFMGFMWNDFYTNKTSVVGPRGVHFTETSITDPKIKDFSGWVFGHAITKNILSWPNSNLVTLQAVIRAHQHNNKTGGPMLNFLCKNRGLVDIWGDKTVYCLVSAPDSILNSDQCFIYDSFFIINIEDQYKDWIFTHYWSNPLSFNKNWLKEKLN